MIEFARNCAEITNATSEEFEKSGEFIVHYMKGQTKEGSKGGSMRLGAYDCDLEKGSLAHKVYQTTKISERHRHRLEVNNEFVDKLVKSGITISGKNSELNLVEIIELSQHPFFIGCQYHPEFKSKPDKPHPLFSHFIKASYDSKLKGKKS